ncbi:MAG TPA: hypothetical protein VE715_13085 [Blastocatellia bacterium]|nr:hypothetical protein [Blastocatellia bacterium]
MIYPLIGAELTALRKSVLGVLMTPAIITREGERTVKRLLESIAVMIWDENALAHRRDTVHRSAITAGLSLKFPTFIDVEFSSRVSVYLAAMM